MENFIFDQHKHAAFIDKYILDYIEKKEEGETYISSILGKEIFDDEEKQKVYDSFSKAYKFEGKQPGKLWDFLILNPRLNLTMVTKIRGTGKNRNKMGFMIKQFDPNDTEWLKDFM